METIQDIEDLRGLALIGVEVRNPQNPNETFIIRYNRKKDQFFILNTESLVEHFCPPSDIHSVLGTHLSDFEVIARPDLPVLTWSSRDLLAEADYEETEADLEDDDENDNTEEENNPQRDSDGYLKRDLSDIMNEDEESLPKRSMSITCPHCSVASAQLVYSQIKMRITCVACMTRTQYDWANDT